MRAFIFCMLVLPSASFAKSEYLSSPRVWELVAKGKEKKNSAIEIFDFDQNPIVFQRIRPDQWRKQMSAVERLALLLELARVGAADRVRSQRVACFRGGSREVYDSFLVDEGALSSGPFRVDEIAVSPGIDDKLMGVDLVVKAGQKRHRVHFRIPSCYSVLTQIPGRKLKPTQIKMDAIADSLSHLSTFALEDGFANTSPPLNRRLNQSQPISLRMDYETAKAEPRPRPWKGLDATDPDMALRLAQILKRYFYQGMADQNLDDSEQNFNPWKNSRRYWCNMPWENVGTYARESEHALTTGRPNESNLVYPAMKVASAWGIAFYNADGCTTLNKIFGPSRERWSEPRWQGAAFPQGTMIAKIHFTENDGSYLDGALEWTANVRSPYAQATGIQKLRHYQMDIAVKDQEIKGANPENNFWVMATYYFDKDYSDPDPDPAMKSYLPQLKHMRPAGIQYGFQSSMTVLFSGARTNSDAGLLSGPADSPQASCLACHAVAGTNVPPVPGINAYGAKWSPHAAKGLDYSLSLVKALNNFYTRPRLHVTSVTR